MDLEKRISLIYAVLRPYTQLGHNELWQQVRAKFKGNSSFAYRTFEKTLKEMVKLNIVYRQEDKKSKLGRVWYSVALRHSELNAIVSNNIDTFIYVVDRELRSFRKKYSKLNNYDKAVGLSRFYQVILLYKFITEKYSEIFPQNKGLRTLLHRWRNMLTTLKRLSPADGNTDNKEVNQLLLMEITNIVGEDWSKLVMFDRTLNISKH